MFVYTTPNDFSLILQLLPLSTLLLVIFRKTFLQKTLAFHPILDSHFGK